MKRLPFFLSLVACSIFPAFAGTATYKSSGTVDNSAAVASPLSFEFDAEETYVGEGSVKRGGFSVRDFEENDALARLIFTPRIKFGILRLGASYERYDFGIEPENQIRNGIIGGRVRANVFQPLDSELPDRLEAANFIVGLDTEFTDKFLIRIEAHPGWYGAGGDLFDGDNFRVPFIAGTTYVYSPDLQFTFGVSVNFEGQYPVVPGGGVRWHFAPAWTLNAVVPAPRLEYEVNKSFTAYAGAVIKSDTYKVNDRFGDLSGNRRLNNAYLTYTEVRTGLGFDWKVTPGITFSAEGGYQPYRTFDYDRPSVRYRTDGGAPYGTIALKAAF